MKLRKHGFFSFVRFNSSKTADFRSDTVTKPCELMRKAMAHSEVGDDCYQEDPTTNLLEENCADLLGKENALFVPSGCMGNLIATAIHCQRGDEMLVGTKSHMYRYEAMSPSVLLGVGMKCIETEADGTLDIHGLIEGIRIDDEHFARTAMIAIENTAGQIGGQSLDIRYLRELKKVAETRDIPVHMVLLINLNIFSFF